MRHDNKKDGEKDGKSGKDTGKALAEQAEAAKSINQLSKQELEDLLKKVSPFFIKKCMFVRTS